MKKKFEEDIKNVDEDDVEYASKKGTKKVEDMDKNPPGFLEDLWNDIKLMISLISDYYKGNYTDVPWKIIAAIAGAIVYFVSPIDVVPDFIPILGYADDALVLKLALELAKKDLDKYEEWKQLADENLLQLIKRKILTIFLKLKK